MIFNLNTIPYLPIQRFILIQNSLRNLNKDIHVFVRRTKTPIDEFNVVGITNQTFKINKKKKQFHLKNKIVY